MAGEKVLPAGESRHILELDALDGDTPSSLSVVVPPEEAIPLPGEEVPFDHPDLDTSRALAMLFK